MANNLTSPFNLYAKQSPREFNASTLDSTPIDFNDHPSFQINMDGDGEFNGAMKGSKGVHGSIAIVNNADGYELVADSINNVQYIGSISFIDFAEDSTEMTSNDETILIGVYFRDTDKPVLTFSPISAS